MLRGVQNFKGLVSDSCHMCPRHFPEKEHQLTELPGACELSFSCIVLILLVQGSNLTFSYICFFPLYQMEPLVSSQKTFNRKQRYKYSWVLVSSLCLWPLLFYVHLFHFLNKASSTQQETWPPAFPCFIMMVTAHLPTPHSQGRSLMGPPWIVAYS